MSLFSIKTLYGESWRENRSEKLSQKDLASVKTIEMKTSEDYGTPQLVFHCTNGTRYFKCHRDVKFEEGALVDKNSVKLVELVKDSTGETTVHAYGVKAEETPKAE